MLPIYSAKKITHQSHILTQAIRNDATEQSKYDTGGSCCYPLRHNFEKKNSFSHFLQTFTLLLWISHGIPKQDMSEWFEWTTNLLTFKPFLGDNDMIITIFACPSYLCLPVFQTSEGLNCLDL